MFTLFIIFAILLPDLYVFIQTPYRIRTNKIYNIFYWLVPLIFIGLTLKLYFTIGHSSDFKKAVGFMWFIWGWFLFYMPKLVYMLVSVWKYPLQWFIQFKTSFFHWVGIILAIFTIYFLINSAFWGRFDFQINRIQLESEKLPPSFDGTTIVQISDIHIGNLADSENILAKMTKHINEINPDYIMQTGDLVNNYAGEIGENKHYFIDMKAREGKYAILGNHDYGDYMKWDSPQKKADNLKKLEEEIGKMDFKLLKNEAVILKNGNDSIALIGVENWGEPPFPQYGDLDEAMLEVENIPFKILLSHDPLHWDAKVKNKTDIFLTLSGHTHASQAVFNFFGKRLSPSSLKYPHWEGLAEENQQYLYVNVGIGYVFMPFRYNCGPEITVIELKTKK